MADPQEFLITKHASEEFGGADSARVRRELLIARRKGLHIGVFADQTDGIVERKPAASLPGAGPAIFGLIAVRGRMFTLIDPLRLINAGDSTCSTTPRFIVLLAGDEQLALAVDRVSSIAEIFLDEVERTVDDESVIFGRWQAGDETISILNLGTGL